MDALTYADAKQRFEHRNYLVQLLKLTDGNVTDAARIASATGPSSTACCKSTT